MFALPTSFRVLLALDPVDMRKHFDGLWALAVQRLGTDPKSGTICVFANRNRDRVKLLFWDGTGVWVLAKRLERGRFTWPTGGQDGRLALSPEALTLLLAGIDLQKTRAKAWYGRTS